MLRDGGANPRSGPGRAAAQAPPRLRSGGGVLVLEMLPDAESLWEHHQRQGGFPLEIAELQGDKLGTYHRQAELFFPALEERSCSTSKLPWILSIHETHPQYLNQMSQGNVQLLSILARLSPG